jgi:hypothetical protein
MPFKVVAGNTQKSVTGRPGAKVGKVDRSQGGLLHSEVVEARDANTQTYFSAVTPKVSQKEHFTFLGSCNMCMENCVSVWIEDCATSGCDFVQFFKK